MDGCVPDAALRIFESLPEHLYIAKGAGTDEKIRSLLDSTGHAGYH